MFPSVSPSSVLSFQDQESRALCHQRPKLHKAQTLAGRVEFVYDEAMGFLDEDWESPPLPSPPLRRAKSGAARAYIDHPIHPPYRLTEGVQMDMPRIVHGRAIIRNLSEQYPEDPFVQKIVEHTRSESFSLKRVNRTYPQLAVPSRLAMEWHIRKYEQKYGIILHLSTLDELPALMQRLERSVAKPCYRGVIVAASDRALEAGHVAPLLFSFGSTHVECFIMDVLGPQGDLVKQVHEELQKTIEPENIFIAHGGRQFDQFSCRTGALSLLRNALLTFRYIDSREGFREPLKGLLEVEEITDPIGIDLPGEWTYGEQLFYGDESSIVIRDLFSTHVEKRKNPRTVCEFRDQYTEEICYSCTLSNYQNYRAVLAGLYPPSGIFASITKSDFEMKFEVKQMSNTYLIHKAYKRAEISRIEYTG